ncbi:MAG: prephenate dehydrogenase/arogenate dehydrogenase family protein [Kiritimatiellae bacterium]|nr:prephenate dehydrogenase/arogenate dehydrogenase family protein [Kiritimatiellia bacterium]
MKKLAIIGLGLMGGSLGLAIRKKKVAKVVCGYARREETRREALKRGVVDLIFSSPEEAVKGADMVVLCLPVLTIPELATACLSCFDENCIVTDVGSTKAELVAQMDKLLKNSKAVYVGSHPIAGSDETGLDAARVDLYEGEAVVVTPTGMKIDKAVTSVRRMWEGVGARVFIMGPKEHDKTIARTSHLPHLVASMLVNTVYRNETEAWRFCGTGFRDATRIAAGSEEIWHDILKSNQRAVLQELSEFEKVFKKVSSMVKKSNFTGLRNYLADCRQKRLKFEEQFNRERRQ